MSAKVPNKSVKAWTWTSSKH